MKILCQTSEEFPVKVTEAALIRLLAARKEDSELDSSYGVRISCVSGGCAGFRQSLDFEKETSETDIIAKLNQDGEEIRLIIDPNSAEYMTGASLDFVVSDWAEGFKFEGGDKLQKTCACGSSASYCE